MNGGQRTIAVVLGQRQGRQRLFGYFLPVVTNTPMPVWLTYFGPPTNSETWECARNYEYAALTSTNQITRDANLAHVFYALGHILHLNQDLSQPSHVRNDEHLHPWHRWIENYGSKTYQYEPNAFPLEPHGWTYWQSQGFSSVLDFWDRGHFMGNASALDADAAGSDKLGLAGFSNGNFLSEDATYAEFSVRAAFTIFRFHRLQTQRSRK